MQQTLGLTAVTPDKCCSQKCAAQRVQSVGVGWLTQVLGVLDRVAIQRRKKERKERKKKEIKKKNFFFFLKKKKKKLRKQQKAPHIDQGKGATWEEKPLHQQRGKQSVRIRRAAGRQASRSLLIGLKVRRVLKRTSGLNKLMSIVHRMSMELKSKFLDSVNQGRDSSANSKCEVCK